MSHLYRHYDKDGLLLYVGMSINLTSRTECHLSHAKWSKDIDYIKVEKYKTVAEARKAEASAIKKENPKHNIVHSPSIKRMDDSASYAFKKLKSIYGSDDYVAKALGITRQAVLYWKKNGIPLCRAVRIEKITKGAVSAADVLRG